MITKYSMPLPLPENMMQPSAALVPPSEPPPTIAPATMFIDGAVPNPVAPEIIGTNLLRITSDKKHSGDGHRFVGGHDQHQDMLPTL